MTTRSTDPERAPRDAGMSLVESMVALVLLAILSTAVFATITQGSRLTHEDAARVAATNLAVREIEITRDIFAGITRGPDRVKDGLVSNGSPLPGGTVGQPLVVDGTAFKVVRTAQWKGLGNTGSACDQATTSDFDYLQVHVRVEWGDTGGSARSVEMSTTMTAPKGSYSSLDGYIGVKVIDRFGEPVAGATVTATGPMTRSGRTAADGCVLLAHMTAGSYELTMNEAGYVNPAGDERALTVANVVQDQLWRGTIEYDKAATINASFTTRLGWGLPPSTSTGINQIPVTLGNSALVPTGSRSVTGTGSSRSLTKLWPYPSGYELWAGGCVDNDPGDFRTAPVDADPDALLGTSATVPLAPVTVRAPNGRTVIATHAADSACPSGVTVNLGQVVLTGELRTSLPYGTWTLRRSDGTGPTRVVTLTAPDPANPVVPAPTPPEVNL